MKYLIISILMIYTTVINAQQNYKIPFASKDNTIELSVLNESYTQINNLNVKAVEYPSWIIIQNPEQKIKALASNTENAVEFIFSVDKTAVVNKEQSISFAISTPAGEVWMKQVKIVVTSPEKFELYQNYPNPFNPNTIIGFQLTDISKVNLKIYDILGREVSALLDEVKESGYHEVEIDGNNFSSGIYFYQITVKDQSGKTTVARKKMMLLR